MEFNLPDSPGWSAMHLVNTDWGNTSIIVKREYSVFGGVAEPFPVTEGIIAADAVSMRQIDGEDTLVIEREAETAALKLDADIFVLGRGTEVNDSAGRRIDRADLTLDGSVRGVYQRSSDAGIDPVNLFGYEPRQNRINTGVPFDFATMAPGLFRGMRRTGDFAPGPATRNLEGDRHILATTTSRVGETDERVDIVEEVQVAIPTLAAIPFVWEGGSNAPSNWCKRADLALVADTITIHTSRVSVIWRGALPLADYPAADLRRIDIREAA